MEKEREELEKAKKAEALKRLLENRKNVVQVRDLKQKKGTAIINGKQKSFFDWSTSPQPSFVNKIPWQD
jgi:hypothetical protein